MPARAVKRKRGGGGVGAAVADDPDNERPVHHPETIFGVGPAELQNYARRNTVRLDAAPNDGAANASADVRAYLDPTGARYVVVAVDTAAGGALSDEAFAVFLVAGARYALLSARIVVGHDQRYSLSTLPLVFVLALLETIRTTRRMLRAAHLTSAFRDRPFVFPPVLVVLETNYAYGAAVYMQMLRLLDAKRARHPDLRRVDIVFATPVYGWDAQLQALRRAYDAASTALNAAVAEANAAEVALQEAWLAKGGRHRHLNRQTILQDALRKVAASSARPQITGDTVVSEQTVNAEVKLIMKDVMERVLAENNTVRNDAELLERWGRVRPGRGRRKGGDTTGRDAPAPARSPSVRPLRGTCARTSR